MCLNSSQLYTGMWDIVSEVYAKTTDFIPTLFFCGTQEELNNEVKKDYGEVVRLDRFPEVIANPELDWSVTWSLFWGIANKFPEDICMFSGIDDIPISNVLWDAIEAVPDGSFVVPLGNNPYNIPSVDGTKHVVANGYTVGKGKLIKKMFDIEDDLQIELNKVWRNRHIFASEFPTNHANLAGWQMWWGMDEAYISSFVHNNSNVTFFDQDWVSKNLQSTKIDRARGFEYDPEKVKDKSHSWASMPRPLTEQANMDKVTNLLKHMGIW